MLRYGRYRVHLDTVPEGVLVSVHDNDGLVCEVIDVDAVAAVRAALAAAQAGGDEDDEFDVWN
jgi:hypothetical protein